MESLLRAAFVYFFLLIFLRVAGNRTLSELTAFDFLLLLILGDSSQQAITSDDYSVTNAVIIILTLIFLDITLGFLKQKFNFFDKVVDGTPIIIMNNGKLCKQKMNRVKINEFDILESARKSHGLEKIDQIKFAILERDGEISIIPKKQES